MYNTEQIKRITSVLTELNHFFGYAEHPTEVNPTSFFNYDYEDPVNKDALLRFKEYLKVNSRNI